MHLFCKDIYLITFTPYWQLHVCCAWNTLFFNQIVNKQRYLNNFVVTFLNWLNIKPNYLESVKSSEKNKSRFYFFALLPSYLIVQYVKLSETSLSCKQHQDISMHVSTSIDQSVVLCPSFLPVSICKVTRQVIKVCPHIRGAVWVSEAEVCALFVERLHFCIDLWPSEDNYSWGHDGRPSL